MNLILSIVCNNNNIDIYLINIFPKNLDFEFFVFCKIKSFINSKEKVSNIVVFEKIRFKIVYNVYRVFNSSKSIRIEYSKVK